MMLSEFKKSRDKFVVAARLQPNSEEIRKELQKLDRSGYVLCACDFGVRLLPGHSYLLSWCCGTDSIANMGGGWWGYWSTY